ncbi:hypothetical protein [Clostridium beijerinckii]|uniref:Uncharacterized protein n=1 Tax=Clostridium beijerinckii TaxID=1520 RepID=A0AAX0BA81_CLOBE|nr:hypothetical protein [Clostridium beijerinckii]NRT92265.1 hypothetical protein [Clostridium beijerinckii]NYC75592.1 hypothetical protein [Clostridium beijerinckii]
MYYIEITGFEQGYNYINKESNLFYDYMNNDKMIIYKGNELLNKIGISKQKTGFGYKRFFICPVCKERHTRLYDTNKGFVCRNCLDVSIYSARKNMYDENIKNVIKYKTMKLFKKLSDPIPKFCMYDLIEHIPDKPKYMRWDKYELAVKRLYFLHWMWEQCMTKEYGLAVGIYPQLDELSVRDINDMLEAENTHFVYENFLFPQYYRGAYEYLKLHPIESEI